MEFHYHQKTFTLLDIRPSISQENIRVIERIEKQNNITLPASVREWYSVAGAVELLQELLFNHIPTELNEMSEWIKSYTAQAFTNSYLHIVWENQWVWSLVVLLSDEPDPPVFLGHNDSETLWHLDDGWHLHAHTFSDFIYAWAWDYIIFRQWFKNDHVANQKNIYPINPFRTFPDSLLPGPTTYVGNAWFVIDRIDRYVKNGNLYADY